MPNNSRWHWATTLKRWD